MYVCASAREISLLEQAIDYVRGRHVGRLNSSSACVLRMHLHPCHNWSLTVTVTFVAGAAGPRLVVTPGATAHYKVYDIKQKTKPLDLASAAELVHYYPWYGTGQQVHVYINGRSTHVR